MTWYRSLAVLLTVCALVTPAAGGTVEITSCGQDVPAGTVGVVTADLDCQGLPFGSEDRVLRVAGRRLELGGHQLLGVSVVCQAPGGSCRVSGPGEIVLGSLGSGTGPCIVQPGGSRLTVEDVTITDCRSIGVEVQDASRVTLRHVGITRPSVWGVRAKTRTLRLDDVTVSEAHEAGISCSSSAAEGCRVQGRDVTVTDTQYGDELVYFAGLRIVGSVSLQRATLTGNNVGIMVTSSLKLRDSVVVGNPLSDIIGVPGRVRVLATQCDHSRDLGDTTTLGVCALD